jgi:hypothetical protein
VSTYFVEKVAEVVLIRSRRVIGDPNCCLCANPHVDDVISVVEALLVTSESGKSLFLGFEFDDRNLRILLVSTKHFDSIDGADLFWSVKSSR